MPMKKLFTILLMTTLCLVSCSDLEDVQPEQIRKIESFLRGSHRPSLIPEEEIDPAEVGKVSNYYTTMGDVAYRYIHNVNDPERAGRKEVTSTSVATITFRMYVFTYTTVPDTRLPEYTNDRELKLAYENVGLNVSHWPFEPLEVNMAGSSILNGLQLALEGCREGDAVELYMTYNMAYGDDYFAVIPRQSPIYIYFTVDRVE